MYIEILKMHIVTLFISSVIPKCITAFLIGMGAQILKPKFLERSL